MLMGLWHEETKGLMPHIKALKYNSRKKLVLSHSCADSKCKLLYEITAFNVINGVSD